MAQNIDTPTDSGSAAERQPAVARTPIEDDGLRAIERLKLWFFRDLSDEQRWKLFRLNELPAEGNETHAVQSKMLKHVLAALRSSPAVDGVGEPVACGGHPTAYLKDVGGPDSDGNWDECFVPAAKGDPGAFPVYTRSALSPTSDRASVVEECAKVAENHKNRFGGISLAGEQIAAAIRALSPRSE